MFTSILREHLHCLIQSKHQLVAPQPRIMVLKRYELVDFKPKKVFKLGHKLRNSWRIPTNLSEGLEEWPTSYWLVMVVTLEMEQLETILLIDSIMLKSKCIKCILYQRVKVKQPDLAQIDVDLAYRIQRSKLLLYSLSRFSRTTTMISWIIERPQMLSILEIKFHQMSAQSLQQLLQNKEDFSKTIIKVEKWMNLAVL